MSCKIPLLELRLCVTSNLSMDTCQRVNVFSQMELKFHCPRTGLRSQQSFATQHPTTRRSGMTAADTELLQLSPDLLHQVVGRLDPGSILRLTVTNKHVRKVVLPWYADLRRKYVMDHILPAVIGPVVSYHEGGNYDSDDSMAEDFTTTLQITVSRAVLHNVIMQVPNISSEEVWMGLQISEEDVQQFLSQVLVSADEVAREVRSPYPAEQHIQLKYRFHLAIEDMLAPDCIQLSTAYFAVMVQSLATHVKSGLMSHPRHVHHPSSCIARISFSVGFDFDSTSPYRLRVPNLWKTLLPPLFEPVLFL